MTLELLRAREGRDPAADLFQRLASDVRGRGLMIGIELDMPYKEVRSALLFKEHCFTGCSGTNVIRLLPPLCLTIEQADQFVEKFTKVLNDF